ncbi:glycosyl hydrolases family 43 domain-containing protein [Hirsutella rhossiliensis]|uniref:Glycosyl hydrolases family 43 domain-containing protein n=1 Tax=Hirsutella rhossiliensis TaxID=111463 RepID=A0A9P8SF16_9HYPO|nr:glycosyl hydrolases family 43 domain-containing protein [Hirsutella rhossiliensis]KAH0960271.1 glycosyl hydrolases family 43 domain-containing protein [Hirsutella rhossiliensis]
MIASFNVFLTWMTVSMNVRQASPLGQGGPAIDSDFPDPTIVQDLDGAWYAFATEHAGVHVQAARASAPEGPWTKIDGIDLLPKSNSFFTGSNTWAPDVRVLGNDSYVLYFSGQVASNDSHHCVGVATSTRILGPYTPKDEPFQCDLRDGGEIDPSSFRDVDGKTYVTYKVDGNSIGAGGECNNGINPKKATPIVLQEVSKNGVEKIGSPRQILDRVGDEPLVEAPAIYRARDGTYILFFSSGCFTAPSYNVNYATSKSVGGPYTRASTPLISSNDSLGLTSPGGATPVQNGDVLVFHANCEAGRCMFVRKFDFRNRIVRLL